MQTADRTGRATIDVARSGDQPPAESEDTSGRGQPPSGVRDFLKTQHRTAAAVVGQLSLRIEGRSVSPSDLIAWADKLEEVAKNLRSLAS